MRLDSGRRLDPAPQLAPPAEGGSGSEEVSGLGAGAAGGVEGEKTREFAEELSVSRLAFPTVKPINAGLKDSDYLNILFECLINLSSHY